MKTPKEISKNVNGVTYKGQEFNVVSDKVVTFVLNPVVEENISDLYEAMLEVVNTKDLHTDSASCDRLRAEQRKKLAELFGREK